MTIQLFMFGFGCGILFILILNPCKPSRQGYQPNVGQLSEPPGDE